MATETDDVIASMAARVQSAAAAGTPLRIRGGGSKDFYGQALQGDMLDMAAYAGIVSYEPSELVVTVRAGTPLAELEALLAAQGQCLPFEPPHFGEAGARATVGGMVASGLNGPARSSVGAVRDYMLGVVLLNGKGERLVFGGQVMKNVAGYDVSRLMAGSLGTLGVLLEVSLKVLPVAPMEATLVFEMDEAAALQQLNRWGAMPLPVNASCWREGRLYVRLRGAKAAVAAAQKSMGGEILDSDAARHWAALREQAQPFFALQGDESLWRLSVPDTAPPLNLGETLVEWGGAQRWVKRPDGDAALIREAAAQASGHATLFRSATKSVPVFSALKPPLDRIHRELKKQFDPAGVFNPGRMYAGW
ncbi:MULTISPECIES: glycolate oxidase subunit GlcE [unclassified Polaromonas]|uniref:glycolate oxidase subunit GlcE n=1 Tax=unclassified Polaromonas TaxID=2638319 RepID=UPI000F079D2D|nr:MULTISPECIES: glycolate oxidase subunit GlcE [unclassified Polaromonas]AYQ27602.1 glycolate oxidase subunit GlcE [Polaromonas sp. SP1]QGJ17555.1 glycolate oxidase subunit GlcE [Polaromonas sp. Pch-P]